MGVEKVYEKTHPKIQLNIFQEDNSKTIFQAYFIGLMRQDFCSSGGGVCGKRSGAALMCKKDPGGFKTNMALAKVEQIINFGDVSIIAYLRKGKIYWAGAV